MNLLITGGTGFVGKNLSKLLIGQGHHVYIVTRSPHNHENTSHTTFISYDEPVEQLPVIHGVINLAGESLFGYWSKKKKEAIRSSRIKATQQVIEMMKKMEKKPSVFISGSAVGYYGTSEEFIFTEETTQSGNDFLAAVTTEWENTAKQAEELGIRTLYTRFGIILGQEGALQYMKLPVKLFAGGKIGSGEQWMSWVHIDDVVSLIHHCIINENISGPINVTAPLPKRNKDFTKVLASILKRPYWLPSPAPLIRLTIGEMSELITRGQYVLPKKAQEHNYTFSFPYLQEALRDIERTTEKLS